MPDNTTDNTIDNTTDNVAGSAANSVGDDTNDNVGNDTNDATNSSPRTNLVMIGMPGAGKSTLGVVLAKILGLGFEDTDLTIQNQCGKTLPVLIDENGPEGFIQIENDILKTVDVTQSVISTGGSAVYSAEAMEHLRSIGLIVYLRVDLEELEQRLGGLHERGVVMKDGMGMELSAIYDERIPLYEHYAEVVLDVDGKTVRESATELTEKLRELQRAYVLGAQGAQDPQGM